MNNTLEVIGILSGGALGLLWQLESSDSPAPSTSQNVVETAPVERTAPAPKPTSNCHPSYSGCLKMNAGDYDCAGGSGDGPNYTGTVRVYGSDPFGLDRDNDG